ncbi:MAG: trigger factor [Mariprofundaceae bacterium]|nr:trigger factor [Mariprofundaceae bacterium]
MIQTEVKKLGDNEHAVNVQIAQEEYDRIYAAQVDKLIAKLKLPGFRPGKTPKGVVEKQFGNQAHEDTVSELVQKFYADAIEQSGLMPAVQPQLEMPAEQPEAGFRFTLKVVTWPEVKLKALKKLSVKSVEVEVTDADMQSVIDRLMDTQVRYETEDGRAAENGDQVTIDFAGFVDNEPFEGGRGEDVKLLIGAGQFIPGFEDGLTGANAGEERTLDVTFPADYQHQPLAGKAARFEVQVKAVARSQKAANEDELAKIVSFDDAAALRNDIRNRLEKEAEEASYNSSREAVLDALLAAHDISLPEAMVEQDMRQSSQRVVQSMQQQGMEVKPEMFSDPAWQDELRKRSERALRISLLLSVVREENNLDVSDDEVEAELDAQATQYPADQLDSFKSWMKSQKEQMAGLRDKLLEKKCVTCIMEQAKTTATRMTLDAWQAQQDAKQAQQAEADSKE